MNVTVYNCREFDEEELFFRYAKELGIGLTLCQDAPDMDNISLANGSECVNIITSKMTEELLAGLKENGVSYLTTRTIGYDHIDMEAAKNLGIRVGNAPYGPHGVADYTVMLILMSIRKMKRILQRGSIQDFSLEGIQGRELKDLTVGIIGTGRIGRTVIHSLSGFGCKMLAYDLYENEEVKKEADYVSLEELWQQADIITLHAPLTEENYHMIGKSTISKMKDGVVIINTARGGLIDTEALISGIESGKISAAGLDVVENEFGLYYYDRKSDTLDNRELSVLRGFPNVTVTHHMAFYTDDCVETVIRDSLMGCKLFVEGKENPWEVA
ncbi:D-lactate dehydrogenase [Kineothrix alysoides]|uniref:D-lactate dehydrogenase n=1 Tax=Kineothrix alysoides TaxID=1469948 RepID=A0A4R1QR85_9FIRM|nr:D-isomer specific 2-hydroxyacid dehydrogenase family protein [Kineothrix alysoides]TCL55443.1 D-lactate dehydrogenase [Kineothrix alysoides]